MQISAGHPARSQSVPLLVYRLHGRHIILPGGADPCPERIAGGKPGPGLPEIYRTVRFLERHEDDEQPEDGTHRTVWIMDPVVEGEDYGYNTLLRKAYDADQAEEYIKLIDEWEACGQTVYVLKQSAW